MSNPRTTPSASPAAMLAGLWAQRSLIGQMAKREVQLRYRGSFIGMAWSFVTPILMLVVYTFVFSVVFQARWGTSENESQVEFAVVLFVGMIIFTLFAETINRAPTLILSNVNYVKKVVFPLEILPVVSLVSSLFHAAISFLVLLIAIVFTTGDLEPSVLFFPLIVLPLLIATLGAIFLLASLGVFIRDIGQTVGIITTAMMFLSPVFYPISSLPDRLQPFLQLNPLTFVIEQARAALIFGQSPDWSGLFIYYLVCLLAGYLGFFCFQKLRGGFADVL
ncbi:MAG: ABC transporter permease [Pseudohongiellaceae bacterium]|nr:ABC transporter permease [Pseudohongiellaceae bacterium]